VPASCIALELNDALLAVADESGVLAAEPGYAVVGEGGARFGQDALPLLRRQRHLASTRYWRDFSEQPFTQPLGGFRSNAELVAAQLQRLWSRHGAGRDGILYATPPWWTAGQLQSLVALSGNLGIRVLGLADAAVAACRHEHPGRELLQLDASLHSLTLSQIRQAGLAQLGDREGFPTLGIEPLLRLATGLIARRFIESSRFDPLHDSAAEQALFDRLPDWLPRLARDAEVSLELDTRSGRFAATLQAADFRAQLARACEPLLQKLRARVAERGPHALQVHPRLADIPGVLEALMRLPDTVVYVLGPGAAAAGLVGRVPACQQPEAAPVVVAELVWDQNPAASSAVSASSSPAVALPTHLLVGHRAYRLGSGLFRIGAELAPGEAGVALDPALRGLSRQHCTLRQENGSLLVLDHSRFGTLLNGHRIEGAALLQPGDVLSLGSPAVELRLLAEVDANGA
jgi:hypothetical protein